MYSVSAAYLNAIKSSGRELKAKFVINSLALTLDDSNIMSFSFNDGIVMREGFQIGTTVAAAFDMVVSNHNHTFDNTIFENAEGELFIGIVVDDAGTVEYCTMGLFTIENAPKPLETITLNAIDRMHKFEQPYTTALTYPATLGQIAQEICTAAGVTLKSAVFNNSTFVVQAAPVYDFTPTLRQAIGWVAEASGGFAKITRDGQLEITWLRDTAITVDGNSYSKLTVQDGIQTIDKLTIMYGDFGVSIGTGNNEYIIQDNPFLLVDSEADYSAIYSQLISLSYKPLVMNWIGNPALEAGDKIIVSGLDDIPFVAIVTNNKLTYGTGLKAESQAAGKSQTARDFASRGGISEQIKGARAQIKVLTDEVEFNVKGDINNIKSYLRVTETGTYIGRSDSPMQIRLGVTQDDAKLDLLQNGIPVAYINKLLMYITKLHVTQSAIIGVHLIEKYNDEITLIRYVGEGV
jgi:hypothetical protein